MRINNAVAITQVQAITAAVDAGAGVGVITILTGSAPLECELADTGTLLATLPMTKPSYAAGVDVNPGARITAATITSAVAAATGTAGYYREKTSTGVCVTQGSCGTSGADMNFDSVSIQIGAQVSITAKTITQPET